MRARFQCACVVCAEGENGQHFRDFLGGAVDQDLDGFEDQVEESRRSAPPGDAIEGDDFGPTAGDGEVGGGEAGDDAEAERILAEATDFGVDDARDDNRPSEADAAAADEHDEADEQDLGDEQEAAAPTGQFACDLCCACHVASVHPHIWGVTES